jgi:hypothetical protein
MSTSTIVKGSVNISGPVSFAQRALPVGPSPIFYAPLSSSIDASTAGGNPSGTFTRSSTSYRRNPSTGYYEEMAIDIARFEDTDNDSTADAILLEAESTNYCLESRDLSVLGTWTRVNNPTLTQNASGIDGVANTAWTCTDSSNNHEFFYQDISITSANQFNTLSVFVLKDNNDSVFPALRIEYKPGSPLNTRIFLNTKTGATRPDNIAQVQPVAYGSIDRGLWWQFWICGQNTTRGVLRAVFHIAISTTWGDVLEATAQRSVVVDQFQVELDQKYPTSPIPTGDSPVTRATEIGKLSWERAGNLDLNNGTIYAEYKWPVYSALGGKNYSIVGTKGASDATNSPMYHQPGTGTASVIIHDGTSDTYESYSAGSDWVKTVTRWNSTTGKKQAIVNGSAWSEESFDGTLDTTGTGINLYASDQSVGLPTYYREIKIWDEDRGESWGNSETT